MTITQRQALAITRANNIEDTEFFQVYGDESWTTYDEEEIQDWAWVNKAVLLG